MATVATNHVTVAMGQVATTSLPRYSHFFISNYIILSHYNQMLFFSVYNIAEIFLISKKNVFSIKKFFLSVNQPDHMKSTIIIDIVEIQIHTEKENSHTQNSILRA